MQPTWQRVAWAAGFGLYIAVLGYVSLWNEDAEIAILGLMFGLGALMGYAVWPKDAGARLRPSWNRIAGALGMGLVFALLVSLAFSLVLGTDRFRPSFMASLLIGSVNAYLAWPGIEREIDQRRAR